MTKLREPEPVSTGSAADFIPPSPTLPKLSAAARSCRGCDLWVTATQTVFGEGPGSADLMFVGEAPGDLEDRAGHPFVGPAGKLLDTAMMEAGIDRGKPMPSEAAEAIIATVHPSAVLRAPDGERERARMEFVADLKRVATYLRRTKAKVAASR